MRGIITVTFLVGITSSSALATELNGTLKTGKTIVDLKPVVTAGARRMDKIPPLPERNPLRVVPVPLKKPEAPKKSSPSPERKRILRA